MRSVKQILGRMRYGEEVLITIVVTVVAVAAAAGAVIAGGRDDEPALIPVPVKRPQRRS